MSTVSKVRLFDAAVAAGLVDSKGEAKVRAKAGKAHRSLDAVFSKASPEVLNGVTKHAARVFRSRMFGGQITDVETFMKYQGAMSVPIARFGKKQVAVWESLRTALKLVAEQRAGAI